MPTPSGPLASSAPDAATAQQPSLLDLPDACITAIMQRCEPISLLCAASTSSSLRTAAVAALPSLACNIKHQRQLDSLQRYLAAHSQHVKHLDLQGSSSEEELADVQLPPGVALENLSLRHLPQPLSLARDAEKLSVRDLLPSLRLSTPGGWHLSSNAHGLTGVLAGQSRLTKLVMHCCVVPAGAKGLKAAVQKLPSLQHLETVALSKHTVTDAMDAIPFPGEVLQDLRALTFLQLNQGATDGSNVLQHLSALTALQDLRISRNDHLDGTSGDIYDDNLMIKPDMLATLSRLTSLRINCSFCSVFTVPAALTGKPHLQHLQLPEVIFQGEGGTANYRHGTSLLLEVQHMQELSHLDLTSTLYDSAVTLPASAYSALQDCSRLQFLAITSSFLPAGVWQQLFGPGKHLQQLRVLDISRAKRNCCWNPELVLTAADASCLTICCPSLQQLAAHGTLRDAAAVAALQSLSSLSCLLIGGSGIDSMWAPQGTMRNSEGLAWADALAQLTQLVELDVRPEGTQWGQGLEVDLLQLTPLSARSISLG